MIDGYRWNIGSRLLASCRLHRGDRQRGGGRRLGHPFCREGFRYATTTSPKFRLTTTPRREPRRRPSPLPIGDPVELPPALPRARDAPRVHRGTNRAEDNDCLAPRTTPKPPVQEKIAAPYGAAGRPAPTGYRLSIGERVAACFAAKAQVFLAPGPSPSPGSRSTSSAPGRQRRCGSINRVGVRQIPALPGWRRQFFGPRGCHDPRRKRRGRRRIVVWFEVS